MILRSLAPSPAPPVSRNEPPSATELFLASQRSVTPPFAIVLQIAHSELAGELVRHLLPSTFGDLPPEVAEAAWKHDLGWADSDARQLTLVPQVTPRPFPAISSDDELPSWLRSLTFAEAWSPLTRVLISRHFTALANQPTAAHAAFLAAEDQRRAELEDTLDHSFEDLDRWTAAIGFCDLLSLYLCSGLTAPATLPLAHPADPDADEASTVTFSWSGDQLTFSEPVFEPGTHLRAEAQRYQPTTGALEPLALRWTLA